MQVLTDSRPAGDWLLGEQRWIQVSPASLGAAERELWGTLADGRPAWRADLPGIPPWRRLLIVNRASGSQFDVLQRHGEVMEQAGPTACVALTGDDFHGLRERRWEALPGNLHLSVALPMDRPVRDLGPGLSVLPAVAVRRAVHRASGGAISPGIKWVNDLLVDGRKVSGVLTATRVQGAKVQLAVLGAGVNLEQAPKLQWTPFVPEAGSLRQLPGGADLTPAALLRALLHALGGGFGELLADGPLGLLETYRRHALVLGREVLIWEEGDGPPDPPARQGVVEAINEDLSLSLRGQVEPVTRGRLAFADVVKSGAGREDRK